MLYATTRTDAEVFDGQDALSDVWAPDGGYYVPAGLKPLSPQDLQAMEQAQESEILARLMNAFFSTRLSRMDVEFFLGKQLLGLVPMSYRMAVVEGWHNPEGTFDWLDGRLARLTLPEGREPGQWLRVVSRIWMITTAWAQMRQTGQLSREEKLDIALPVGDFTGPMAAWYARELGLPIGRILCCCNENDGLWQLMQSGRGRPGLPVQQTLTPLCDVACPPGLERLIYAKLGAREARRFAAACQAGEDFRVEPELFAGFSAAVVHDRRIGQVISNVHATNGYILSAYGALVHAGLMDYRVRTGARAPALLLCEDSPVQTGETVCEALGVSRETLGQMLERM